MNKWNPLFTAYAAETGTPDPEKCLERDREKGPVMLGFILWVSEAQQAWLKFNPKPHGYLTHEWISASISAFHAWLLNRAV